ncbi:MAG: LLM class flavin-dependent oxidoreductase [Proteobacteria bacterium]|nr:MAG: LLM class flavin-dependent oxidoreductase [Pseudomonadota bacterium]
MKFGVFDHLDHSGLPFGQHYENRLRLAEAYDRAGLYGYHVAEHHSTPLGIAASPGIFLSAVAQRTQRLRFGPLVYLLPFYHPIRLIEEICMLDQMSAGRLQLGIGRGVSPYETAFYGIDFAQSQDMYHEAYQLLMKGLTVDELSFEGKYYQFRDVPMILKPVQKPHPPLWYGIGVPENAAWPAANDVNIVIIALRPTARAIVERYRAERERLGKREMPLVGVSKHVVVAETDAEARRLANRAYPIWLESFRWLFKRHGTEPRIIGMLPPTFDELMEIGNGIAGSPRTVRDFIAAEREATGINYFVSWLAFGDLTLAESQASLDLFAREVMPEFAATRAAAE